MQNLTPVQQRLCWLYYTNFVRAGAKLDADAKKRVAAINERLAALFANFSQNLLADEADYALYLKEERTSRVCLNRCVPRRARLPLRAATLRNGRFSTRVPPWIRS